MNLDDRLLARLRAELAEIRAKHTAVLDEPLPLVEDPGQGRDPDSPERVAAREQLAHAMSPRLESFGRVSFTRQIPEALRGRSAAQALALVEAEAEGMAREVASEIQACVEHYVEAELQRAVSSRKQLTDEWPWSARHRTSAAWVALQVLWPRDRHVDWPSATQELKQRRLQGQRGPGVWVPFKGCELLWELEREVRAAARERLTRLPATANARSVFRLMSDGGKQPASWRDPIQTADGGRIELVHAGRVRPVQLSLTFDAELPRRVLRAILEGWKEDGVRDWIVLHRMAGEQGSDGDFRWSWSEHRERTAYAQRTRSKNRSDDEQAQEVVRRLWEFKNTELRLQRATENGTAWLRIGPFGLVDIPAGYETLTSAGRSLRVAAMQLNPELYRGAHRRNRKLPNHFALFQDAALTLRGPDLCLYVELLYGWQDARGAIRRKAFTLWEQAGLLKGSNPRHRWPRKQATLERMLNRIGKATGMNWHRDGELGAAVYTIRPPDVWSDRAIHSVRPQLMLSKGESVPRTGAELKAWRKEQSLSLRALAEQLQTSKSTLSRHEKGGALPSGLVESIAQLVPER